MQITALGHSCVLLDLEHARGHTRILVDPWLTDHTTGDAMGRFPRLRFEVEALGRLNAVFISHAHSDHLDPYTLVRLWRELEHLPTLILPVTLAFLEPLFREHLHNPTVLVLAPYVATPFAGVELLGLYDVGLVPTNEDDVMVLVVDNGEEVVLVEADARLSLENPSFRDYLTRLLRAPGLTSAVWLTTENELTGTLESRNCADLGERAALHERALEELHGAVEQLYTPTGDPDDLWQASHLLRLIHGQGLTAPHELDPRWQQILFPVRIEDRVQAERDGAVGCAHRIDSLTVGAVHTLEAGQLTASVPLAGLALLDQEPDRTYDPTLAFFPDLPLAPLRGDARDPDTQSSRLLTLLNHRFLPFLHGQRDPPLLHLVAGDGCYRLRVFFGDTLDAPRDYVLGFAVPHFIEQPVDDGAAVHEAYWANDLDDLLDGRCDEFTTFCRTQFPTAAMRLWSCLATPLLNADLVTRRVALHFERACQGLTPGSYVVPLYGEG